MGNSEEIQTPHGLRRPGGKPTTEKERTSLRMSFVRDIASSNPSFKLDHSRLAQLTSALEIPTHPAYHLMIRNAIEKVNEGIGASEKAISEFIVEEYEGLPLAHEEILRYQLGKLCNNGEVLLTENEHYILSTDALENTRRRKESKTGEETDAATIKEGNRSRDREIEGIHEHINREDEREEVVKEVHSQRKSLKLDAGVSNEAIAHQFSESVQEYGYTISEVIEEHIEWGEVPNLLTSSGQNQISLNQCRTQKREGKLTSSGVPLRPHQVLGKRKGRPQKPKPGVALDPEAALSSALQPDEAGQGAPKWCGRGRPRKTNADKTSAVLKPSRGRGRPPKAK